MRPTGTGLISRRRFPTTLGDVLMSIVTPARRATSISYRTGATASPAAAAKTPISRTIERRELSGESDQRPQRSRGARASRPGRRVGERSGSPSRAPRAFSAADFGRPVQFDVGPLAIFLDAPFRGTLVFARCGAQPRRGDPGPRRESIATRVPPRAGPGARRHA